MLVCRNYGAIKLIVPLIVTYFVAIQTGRVISKVVGKLTHLYTVTFNLLSTPSEGTRLSRNAKRAILLRLFIDRVTYSFKASALRSALHGLF